MHYARLIGVISQVLISCIIQAVAAITAQKLTAHCKFKARAEAKLMTFEHIEVLNNHNFIRSHASIIIYLHNSLRLS